MSLEKKEKQKKHPIITKSNLNSLVGYMELVYAKSPIYEFVILLKSVLIDIVL
mgnify:CR=1 FL=1